MELITLFPIESMPQLLQNQISCTFFVEQVKCETWCTTVVRTLGCMIRGKTVNKEVKKALMNSIIVLTLTYTSETWMWNECQKSKIETVEMSYLRGGCGVNRMSSEGHENVYEDMVCLVREED